MLLIPGGIETNPGPELPIDDELSSSFNDSSEMSSIGINNICSTNNKKNMCITLLVNLESTVGLSGKLGADLSTLVIFVIFFRHFFKTNNIM
jgi:hypothetical protein